MEQGLLQGLRGPGHSQQKWTPKKCVWTLGMGVQETVILSRECGGIHHYLPTHLGPLSLLVSSLRIGGDHDRVSQMAQ